MDNLICYKQYITDGPLVSKGYNHSVSYHICLYAALVT